MEGELSSRLQLNLPTPVERFSPEWDGAESLSIWVKRDDLLHPVISGNKWRKLRYALSGTSGFPARIVSFGGGYSNHLHALGYVCHQLGIPFTAIVRGHYTGQLTPTLQDLSQWQAELHFVDRKEYALRNQADYILALQSRYPHALIIPEGGSQQLAIRGVAEILTEPHPDFDVLMAPVGSGATLAGLISALAPHQRAIGVAALKGEHYLESLVSQFLPQDSQPWHIDHRFHGGGFAKATEELRDFCTTFNQVNPFVIEPVYSGKLFFAARTLVERGELAPGTRLLLLHTGGLQGARKK